jgi:hypothetical protein
MRHQSGGEYLPVWQMRVDSSPDVIEKKPQTVFAPLALDDGLFGAAFQEFRARMFLS